MVSEHCVEDSISYRFVKKLTFCHYPLAKIFESESGVFSKKWKNVIPFLFSFIYLHRLIILAFVRLIYTTAHINYLFVEYRLKIF
jgi:hypothetical protein